MQYYAPWYLSNKLLDNSGMKGIKGMDPGYGFALPKIRQTQFHFNVIDKRP